MKKVYIVWVTQEDPEALVDILDSIYNSRDDAVDRVIELSSTYKDKVNKFAYIEEHEVK